MATSAATLARCLNFGDVHDHQGWATRALAAEAIRDNPIAWRYDMKPVRVHNAFSLYWVAASIVRADDVRVIVAYLCRGGATWSTTTVDAPDAAIRQADVPVVTAELAARHVGRRWTLCDRSGAVSVIEVTGVDGDIVTGRNLATGRHVLRRAGDDAVLRGAVHRIEYAAGSEATSDGPPRYDMSGGRIESTGYFYSAWCSCGQWRHSGTDQQGRRFAVISHLDESR